MAWADMFSDDEDAVEEAPQVQILEAVEEVPLVSQLHVPNAQTVKRSGKKRLSKKARKALKSKAAHEGEEGRPPDFPSLVHKVLNSQVRDLVAVLAVARCSIECQRQVDRACHSSAT